MYIKICIDMCKYNFVYMFKVKTSVLLFIISQTASFVAWMHACVIEALSSMNST
jgi:hypothetical protein